MQTLAHVISDAWSPVAQVTTFAAIQVKSRGVIDIHVGASAPAIDAPAFELSLSGEDGLPALIVLTDLVANTDVVYAKMKRTGTNGNLTTIQE
jgi:hypothetical protein